MANRNWIDDTLRDPEIRLAYETEGICLEFAEALLAAFAEKGLSQREVAKRVDLTESAVSRSLSGDHNMTLETLAKLAFAAGLRVRPSFAEINEECPYRIDVQVRPWPRSPVSFRGHESPFDVEGDEESPVAA